MPEKLISDTPDWRPLLLEDPRDRARVLSQTKRIAVLGIKPSTVGGPAYEVPAVLQALGYGIVPVPVYYPDVETILGEPVHRQLGSIEGPVDMVILFRRPTDVPSHLDELLALHPATVWMQSGIRHDAVARALASAGIAVVQDACAKIEALALAR